TDGKIRSPTYLHARAIAIVPWVRGMAFDILLPFELGVAQQSFPQDGALEVQLRRIAGVLIVASAAMGEVRTLRLDAMRRRLDYLLGDRAREAALLPRQRGRDLFPGKDKGQEDGFAVRQARQPLAAIHHFFNGQIHM